MINRRSCFGGIVLAIYLAGFCRSLAQELAPNSAPTSSQASAQPADVVAGMVEESYRQMDDGNLDEALSGVDAAIQLDSHNASAYELRGSIYIQKKLWDRAEQDYNTALSISPTTIGFKYKLAEIKFMQNAFDEARPRYAAMENDENLGDLATYKVIICDLFGGHDERAAGQLALLKQADGKPSYYYANAAWDMTHHKLKEANDLVRAAQQVFTSTNTDLYLSCLVNVNDLQATVVTFATKSGDEYNQVKALVEDDGLRVSSPTGWMTIPFAQLPDDLSSFPTEMRKQILNKRTLDPESSAALDLISFTTRQGKEYDQVRASVEDDGLKVLTGNGWVSVPFDQLPDDLSSFPVGLREQIAAKHLTGLGTRADSNWVSFTTRQGKEYDQVRVSIEDDGLRALTPDGWIAIPFGQLPDDLSQFPAELRKQIVAKRKAGPNESDKDEMLSFTAKSGKNYDQVRVNLEDDGLQVLTSDGWITVPFPQLPDDLSSFPADLRKQIVAKRKSSVDESNKIETLGFTTKSGKNYDQVRVNLADDGLQVLTSDGWITVPFQQLPDDLSSFPADLRKQIAAKSQAASNTAVGTRWVSFTSKKGKEYDQVRVALEEDGLQVLTSDGWITVPFAQLPDDLSPFPVDLRKQIATKQMASHAASMINSSPPALHPQ